MRREIFLCAEADQAIIKKENSERVSGCDKNIDAQVKLVSVKQQRFVNILLDNEVFSGRNLLSISVKHYSDKENIDNFLFIHF